MADSNITKRALASALKELMDEVPFSKITVAQICEKCDMNRKSFYYHFKDKYELMNWIFDMDLITLSRKGSNDKWQLIEEVCAYLYDNKKFYREALKIRGQNSLIEHMQEVMFPILKNRMQTILGEEDIHPFYMEIFSDMIIMTIGRWIISKDDMTPEEFVKIMKSFIYSAVRGLYKEQIEEQQ